MAPLLEVAHLSKSFAGLAAVKDVSFTVERGGIYGLIGPNGAGKTTLLSLIAGALRPTSGAVVFEGRRLPGGKPHVAARAGIVRTHQVPRPFRTLSALENVEVGLRFGRARGRAGAARIGSAGRAAGEGRIEDAARSAGTARDGRETLAWVGLGAEAERAAGTLSVGNQKRLELARALAARPSLLLCDEVCSGLTAAETAAVLALLREIRAEGTTILYCEHNLKAIMSICDHVIVMNYGQKLAEGPPVAMQNDPAVIAAYIGKPAGAGAGGSATADGGSSRSAPAGSAPAGSEPGGSGR
jgi:branched-chain amino acid transport system ATP-binding protein